MAGLPVVSHRLPPVIFPMIGDPCHHRPTRYPKIRVVLSTRFAGSVAIVQLQGSLTLGPNLRRLAPNIEKTLVGKASTGLILNLAGVSDADSSGLGELVAIHTAAKRRRV